MNQIQVNYKLDEQQMKCPICYDTITTPLLQCLNAPHFVCLTCDDDNLDEHFVEQLDYITTSF